MCKWNWESSSQFSYSSKTSSVNSNSKNQNPILVWFLLTHIGIGGQLWLKSLFFKDVYFILVLVPHIT